jgi:hypothetical protein
VRFDLDVLDGESPLDVFYHPYAYAAFSRMREPPCVGSTV